VTRWKKAVLNAAELRELKKDTLYREAAFAFRKNGYHGTSLTDIADELGISKPTLYYYVKNKQDLLYQCHLAAAEQALETICRDTSLPGIERLRRTLAAYVRSTIGPNSYSVIILEEKSLSPEQLTVVVHERDKFEAELITIVMAGMEDGSILPGHPKFAVLNALGTVNWVTKWYRPSGSWTMDEVADGVATFVCRGLAAESEPMIYGNRLLAPTEA
jgi:AcrR family transcriptional regulator